MSTILMKKTSVTFIKEITVTLYSSDEVTESDIIRISNDEAEQIDNSWGSIEWDVIVGKPAVIEVSDDDLKTIEVPRRYVLDPEKPTMEVLEEGSIFDDEEVLVVNDEGTGMVNPLEATWWRPAKD